MLYPVISSYVNQVEYQDVIDKYSMATNDYDKHKNDALFLPAEEYNKNINSYSIVDVFTDPNREESKEYTDILNIDGKGLMGYISIPKIGVRIPIYHGTSSKVLQKGVGHLEGSSFPVGGDSTHSILSAHRGLPSAKLFTDLDQLVEGDKFYIYVLDRKLAYEVDQILVVEPSETEALQLQEGEDYVTLVTCTPYAINTHRLLVRGKRVEYNEEVAKETPVVKKASSSDKILYIGILIAILLLIFAIIQIRVIGVGKKKNTDKDKPLEKHDSFDDMEII